MRGWNASERTIEARLLIAAQFLDGRDLAIITPADVSVFLSNPAYAPATRTTYFNNLKALFRWAVETGAVEVNPLDKVRRPRPPAGNPRPLTPAQVNLVLNSATGNLRAWLILSMFAGLRAHEIAKVRGQDVNEDLLFVYGKGRQSAYVPTHPLIWELAQRMPVKGYWFPARPGTEGHMLGSSISRHVSRHFRTLGIEGSIHRGRHVYGSQLVRNGTNIRIVQTLMRHKSLATTALYLEVAESERRDAVLGLTS
jgi:integrase